VLRAPGRLPAGDAGSGLFGRRGECEELDGLLADVSGGSGRALVLRGEAGVGKSALLAYVAERTSGWHVTTVSGVESDMEVAYGGLQQACLPLLKHLNKLPTPQRNALATVFGLSAGPPPDRFLVGLATLTLIAEAAEDQPLVCFIDDAQWLDRASAQVFEIVGRRLLAERVGLLCAARTGAGDEVLRGLPAVHVRGLGDAAARSLLLAHVDGPLDAAVVDSIVTESHGNPLALLELPRTWKPAELAGGFGSVNTRPVGGKIEDSYARRLLALPAETRLLVLLAAAEPVGDPRLFRRAAEILGLDMVTLTPAVDDGLLRIRRRVEFAHPLVRSVAYRSDVAASRRRVHRALADATDAETDPDRRAWHRARATPGPDEEIAAELERSAGRAQARGGIAAAAAFLRRAVALSEDPVRRVERTLAAAQAGLQAGDFDQALALLATADAEPLDDVQHARVALLRAHVTFAKGLGREAPPMLLEAAKRSEHLDLEIARETYLIAWTAAVFAGHLPRGGVLDVSRAVRSLPPPPDPPRPLHVLLDGLAVLITDGRAAAAPLLQRAATALTDLSLDDALRWGPTATSASDAAWDVEGTRRIATRHAKLVRDAGALGSLQLPLAALGHVHIWSGDFPGAASVIAEADELAAITGSQMPPTTALRLLALQGKDTEARALIARTLEHAASNGQAMAAACAHWAAAVLYNGLARYDDAMTSATQATSNPFEPFVSMWALPELVESAVRADDLELARDASVRLLETTRPSHTNFARGMEARCRALVTTGAATEGLYREAIQRLSRAGLRPELARTHLLHGEWLRGQGRHHDARHQLRTAYDMFAGMGMDAFGARARRELSRTGEKVRTRPVQVRDGLTPQEEQIARLARNGLSNPEIGAQLFLSARTVEWHLRKVFTKLGIASRRELRRALTERERSIPGS
jgi:ATP/maltotriose-dependent transcriptional regulator MalT